MVDKKKLNYYDREVFKNSFADPNQSSIILLQTCLFLPLTHSKHIVLILRHKITTEHRAFCRKGRGCEK